ncbi:MAG: serine hydrolase, partial [Erysipelotrichaceae bacterium]|nr:serine hydrolase [Erysipelotrichaceae bacterium]
MKYTQKSRIMGYVITAMLVAGTSIFTNVTTVCAKVQNHETIEELVTTTQKKACVSNMSVVTVKQNDVSYYGTGKSNEIFQIGSMTKAFTGLGVQKLVEDGKIQIDASVTEYLPDFRVYCDGNEVSITVKQLLNHTSGFTNSEKDYPSATKGMSLQDWYVAINDSGLSAQPGEEFNYSNVNYNLLG